MSAPNQEIYLLIMICTNIEEIITTINKFQAMTSFLKSNTSGLNPPTTQTSNYAVAAALYQIHRTIFLAGLKI